MAPKTSIADRVVQLHGEGKSNEEIAKTLREEGYRGRNGRAIKSTNLGYYLYRVGKKNRTTTTTMPTPTTSPVRGRRKAARSYLPIVKAFAKKLTVDERFELAENLVSDIL